MMSDDLPQTLIDNHYISGDYILKWLEKVSFYYKPFDIRDEKKTLKLIVGLKDESARKLALGLFEKLEKEQGRSEEYAKCLKTTLIALEKINSQLKQKMMDDQQNEKDN
jgi:hypothetical protein